MWNTKENYETIQKVTFSPCKVSFSAVEVVFVATAVRILKILLLGDFLQMFCMKCVLWVNIKYPKAIKHQYNKF